MRRNPRSCGHYSTKAQDKQRYFQDEDLTRVKVWKDFLKIYDRAFWDQAARLRFWRGYDTTQYRPLPSEELLEPSLSYRTTLDWLDEHDASLRCLGIDARDTRGRYRAIISDPTASAEEAQRREVHRHRDAQAYWRRGE